MINFIKFFRHFLKGNTKKIFKSASEEMEAFMNSKGYYRYGGPLKKDRFRLKKGEEREPGDTIEVGRITRL